MKQGERDALLVLTDDKLLQQCSIAWRSGQGPGGQKRNKSRVHIRLTHNDSNTVVNCGDFRTRTENQKRAVRRMRLALALRLRAPVGAELAIALRHYLKMLPNIRGIRSDVSLIGLAHFLDHLIDHLSEHLLDNSEDACEGKRRTERKVNYKTLALRFLDAGVAMTPTSLRRHIGKNSELAMLVETRVATKVR